MTSQLVLIVSGLVFLLFAFLIFINLSKVKTLQEATGSKQAWIKKFLPAYVSIGVLLIALAVSIYFKQKDKKVKEELSAVIAKNGESSYKLESNLTDTIYHSTAVDTSVVPADSIYQELTSLKEATDTAYKSISRIRDYVNQKTAVREVANDFRDTVLNTYSIIEEKKKRYDRLWNAANAANAANAGKQGYAYFGIFYNNGWQEANFKNLTREAGLPSPGDQLEALNAVNLRKGEIEYIDGKGWVNQPWVGVLKKGDRITVKEVKSVAGNYIWVKL